MIFLVLPSIAQERLGLKLDNYSGVNALALNPALGTSLPYSWDVNIVAVGIFADNNYGFIENSSVLSLLKNQPTIEVATDFDDENPIPSDATIANYYSQKNKYYAQGDLYLMGPSFLFQIKNKHSFGLTSAFRAAGGSKNLPGVLGYYEFEEYPKEDELTVAPFKLAMATWSEIGLHYGYQTDNNLAFGITAKYLNGYEGAYLNNYNKTGVIKYNNNEIEFLEANVGLGSTTTYLQDQEFNGLQKNGSGLAIDLGVSYFIEKNDGEGYQLKLGASILDLGFIDFNKNVENHEFNNVNLFSFNLENYQEIESYDQFISLANQDVYGTNGTSFTPGGFKIVLPTALSLQADYAFTKNFFANATLVQNIPIGKNRIARTDVLAITPRFESRWIGAMLPINIINYDQVHVGLSLRLAYLTIGSENLASLFGQSNKFTGSDFYMALKVNPFSIKIKRDKKWKSSNARAVKKRGRSKVKCYF